jgi:hypothetical protein
MVLDPWIQAAKPSAWTLLDPDLAIASLYHVRNVPSVFWIDESGNIVRANDPIYILRRDPTTGETSRNEKYLDAVRDWIANGSSSRFLAAESSLTKRRPPASSSDMDAMASFELGVYLSTVASRRARNRISNAPTNSPRTIGPSSVRPGACQARRRKRSSRQFAAPMRRPFIPTSTLATDPAGSSAARRRSQRDHLRLCPVTSDTRAMTTMRAGNISTVPMITISQG